MTPSERRILVFAPHPDDDLIGCGGSLARRVRQGARVDVVYLSLGESGSLRYSKEELGEMRRREALAAASSLGIQGTRFLGLEDGGIEVNPRNTKLMIRILRELKPHCVYVPHAQDAHRDHKAAHELVKEAVWTAGGPWFRDCGAAPWAVSTLLAYEVWTPLGDIGYVEDITDAMDAKVGALQKHASQVQDWDYVEAVTSFNRYRGILTGRGRYCECFQVLRAGELAF